MVDFSSTLPAGVKPTGEYAVMSTANNPDHFQGAGNAVGGGQPEHGIRAAIEAARNKGNKAQL